MCLDLRVQISDLLPGGGDGIGTGDERRGGCSWFENRDERARELRRVPGLLSILGFPGPTSGPRRSP